MAKLVWRKKVLLLKTEVTYGTDPTPTNSANAMQVKDVVIEPVNGEELSRGLDKATFGLDLSDLVGLNSKVTFKIEASGSGTAGTAPAYSPALKSCGYSETVSAGTSVTYAPIDTGINSVTIYFYHDKKLHKITGARGSLKFMAKKRGYPYWEFTFIGIYNAVSATTTPTPTLSAFTKPVPFRASTVSFELLGETLGLHEIDFDFGQKISFYEHSEEESIQHEEREATASVLFELPEIGTYNWYSAAAAGSATTGALEYIHGATAGNIITIEAPNCQIKAPKDENVQGITALRATVGMTTDGTTYDHRFVFT